MFQTARRYNVKRQCYTLTDEEREAFIALSRRRFHADAAPVWRFWQAVASARGLDHKSIISNPHDPASFTALPLGHGKHWCWPSQLRLPKPAECEWLKFANAS